MKYTVRFAHLDHELVEVGDPVVEEKQIGVMGHSGTGTGAHLHIDVTEGANAFRYSLNEIMAGKPKSSKTQLDYFIDSALFKVKPFITTPYLDPEYKAQFGKDHPAYDVVPIDRHETQEHFGIFWNRSKPGAVVRVDHNDPGYGNCVYVVFEA